MNEDNLPCREFNYEELTDLLLSCHNNGYFRAMIVCNNISEYTGLYRGLFENEVRDVVMRNEEPATPQFELVFSNSATLTVIVSRTLRNMNPASRYNLVLYTDSVPDEFVRYLKGRVVGYGQRQRSDAAPYEPYQPGESIAMENFLAGFHIISEGES